MHTTRLPVMLAIYIYIYIYIWVCNSALFISHLHTHTLPVFVVGDIRTSGSSARKVVEHWSLLHAMRSRPIGCSCSAEFIYSCVFYGAICFAQKGASACRDIVVRYLISARCRRVSTLTWAISRSRLVNWPATPRSYHARSAWPSWFTMGGDDRTRGDSKAAAVYNIILINQSIIFSVDC